MMINRQDTNGSKALLPAGELGFDNYPAGGDKGRVYVGRGDINVPLANKAEADAAVTAVGTHAARVDNPHSVTKTQVGLGNVPNVDATNATNITSGTLSSARLANSGVTANTYKSVVVNAKGIVTGGTNPTTVGGYGITDTYTKTEVQTILPKVGFDITNVVVPGIGQVAWNSTENTLDVGLNGAVLQVGQEQLIRVRNNTGATIVNGMAVMAIGTIGNSGRITIANANLTQANAKMILGVVTEDIAAGADGFVTAFGKVRGIQTNGGQFGETWVDGDVIYVKDSGSGVLTKVAPTDTQVKLPIAIVVHAHGSNGTLFIRVNSIDENHAKSALALKADKSDTYTKGQVDTALALKVDDTEIASVNLLRADKYLAAQNVVKMTYDINKKLIKVQYNNATDIDYEVLSYTDGKLTNVAHYVGSVLKGNTVLTYVGGLLDDAPFIAV